MRLMAVCFAGALAALSMAASADSWMPPTPKTYTSPDGNTRVEITPRGIEGPLAYFEDKVAEKDHAGQAAGAPTTASAEVQHREGTVWRPVRSFALVNDVSPVSALVSNDGRLVTFDNWHSMGLGPDVVVIYDAQGKRIRSLSLEEILPKQWVRHLPRSVSSLWWGGDHAIDPGGLAVTLNVSAPGQGMDDEHPTFVPVRVDLSDGHVIPSADAKWKAAMRRADELEAKRKADWDALRAARLKPLEAPKSKDHDAWRAYVVELRERMSNDDKQWCGDVFSPPEGEYAVSEFGYQLDMFSDSRNKDPEQCVYVFHDTAAMVRDLASAMHEIPANALHDDTLALSGKPGDLDALAQEAARTGLTVRLIDVGTPFPGKIEPEAVPDWFMGPEQ
jgi:hypothetical protein